MKNCLLIISLFLFVFTGTIINKTVAQNANAELAINTADAETIFNLV